MKKLIAKMLKIPSWLFFLLLFAFLYFTGLHKDAVALLQRSVLSIGVMDADVPEIDPLELKNSVLTEEEAEERMIALNFYMKDLSGNKLEFSDFKGKVIFLNLWATWCPPCIAEMPNIQDLHDEVASENIVFVMLSLDKDEAEVKSFLDKYGFTFPVYKLLSNLPHAFQSNSIPSSFIISPTGEVVFGREGIADYDTDEVKNFLRELAVDGP